MLAEISATHYYASEETMTQEPSPQVDSHHAFSPKAWFQSINDPTERYSLDEIVYTATDGSLLEVAHDLSELKKVDTEEWKRVISQRRKGSHWPYASGVWSKKEWVLPSISNDNIVSMYEGNTNLFWAERYGRELGLEDLWIKQCGNSHTGSFKDLGMTVLVSMVRQMISDGKQVQAVACASTGDTSAALAAYAAAASIPSVVFMPKGKVSLAQLIQPVANGAIVFSIDSDFDGCMAIVKRIAKDNGVYLANSMNSLRVEGQKTVAIEIVEQFDWSVPDWVVIPGGNLGNVSALAKGFDLLLELGLIDKKPRICCAQVEAANPLYRSYKNQYQTFEPLPAKPTLATAIQIGNPVSYSKAVAALKKYDGIVEQVSEEELARASFRADCTGLFNCPHTGVALAAMEKLIQKGEIARDERVVVISTANGLKFVDYKVQYHAGNLPGVTSDYANPPIEMPGSYEMVRDEMQRQIEKRFNVG